MVSTTREDCRRCGERSCVYCHQLNVDSRTGKVTSKGMTCEECGRFWREAPDGDSEEAPDA